MTVQANLPPTNTNSDGTTTTFNYGFKVTREEHLKAIYTVIATGETGDLEIDSVTGVGNDGGGTVTFAAAPADGMIVTVDSDAPLSQIEAFTGNKLPPATVERMGDAIAIQNQRQQSQIERSVRFPASDDQIPTLPAKAQRGDKILGFTADGSDFLMVEGAAASQAYVDLAEAQADIAVAATTYPYISGEQKTGAFMPGTDESLTLFTYNSGSAAAATLPAMSGITTSYNIGIGRTAGSGDVTISADDGALINGASSIVLNSDYLCLDLKPNEAGDEWVARDKVAIGVPIGTEAGNIVALDENEKLPAVDGSNLTGVYGADQSARNMAATAMAIADLNNAPGTKGAFYLADNFITDNLAVKTNATYDASGDYYSNEAGYGPDLTTGKTITASAVVSGYPAARATDDNTATNWYGSTVLGAAEHLTVDLGAWNDAEIRQTTFQYSTDGGVSTTHWPNSWGVYYSDNGSSFTLAETVTGLAQNTTVQTKEIAAAGSHRYWRIQNADGARYPSLGELQMMEISTPDNMTLRPTAATLQTADPDDVSGYFRIEPIDSVTMGTDIVGKASIDGGSTWETATWDKLPNGIDGSEELYRMDADVSAQTGSSLIWEITTANNKQVRLHGVVGLIPIY
ncbi:discoidin domain-containing protein [Paremcibacter congregatus]|uniref:discoidin domain-containing protein n=1 Tax=Paremcibacter congregatus TaxID=2043170 RepID=UPI003A93265A